uniref:Putative secreted histamine binding protein of 22.5 kDa n=1 Tax=Ixodes pacificus TaxID=29930 RepID=Q6B879_IXOPA|nr:putative secreted histamine binding protein of 22.5 kDa [Ixodes pacificus]
MKLVLSLAIFVCGVLVGAYGKMTTASPRGISRGSTTTVPPEYDPSKEGEQNATRSGSNERYAMRYKWRTYNVTDPFKGNHPLQCENFKVMERRTPTNYSLQYKYRSGYSWGTLTETLILGFLQQPLPPNDMFFARTPIGIPTHNLVLYSNYVNCTILRIPMPNQGENHCDLWMANMTVSQEPPELCRENFYKYCNTTQTFTVYFPNCSERNSRFY